MRYANAALAFAAAVGTTFTLAAQDTVKFYIRDGINRHTASDNVGGMSLSVGPSSVGVLEPRGLLIAAGWRARRGSVSGLVPGVGE